MALFNKKDTKVQSKDKKRSVALSDATADTKNVGKKQKKVTKGSVQNSTKAPGYIIRTPRITEKAVYMTMQHAYVFEVATDATKRDVRVAIKALYNVTPRKVNIVYTAPRAYVARFRNRKGLISGLKKAYVFLNKGDKIDLA